MIWQKKAKKMELQNDEESHKTHIYINLGKQENLKEQGQQEKD